LCLLFNKIQIRAAQVLAGSEGERERVGERDREEK
jgi:hypothetical protein